LTFLVQIPESRHFVTDCENERWQRERRGQLDQKNNTERRGWISTALNITRFYFMLFIHFEPEKIYAPWTRPGRNPGAARLSVDCRQRKLWPKLCVKPHETDLKQIESRMLVMLEISSVQSPWLVQKIHDPQARRTDLPSTQPSCTRQIKTCYLPMWWGVALGADCYCQTSNQFFFWSPVSPAHIQMWITQKSTVDCKHWDLGSLLIGLESERSEDISDRRLTYVNESAENEHIPAVALMNIASFIFVFHSLNECWWRQGPSVFLFFTIPMFFNYKIWVKQ
jgi:hypothetical protein